MPLLLVAVVASCIKDVPPKPAQSNNGSTTPSVSKPVAETPSKSAITPTVEKPSLPPDAIVHEEKYDNGQIRLHCVMKKLPDGKLIENGEYKIYYPNGKLQLEGTMVNGEFDGKVMAYYDNGAVQEESNFKNGVLHGMLKRLEKDGTVIRQVQYIDGRPQTAR